MHKDVVVKDLPMPKGRIVVISDIHGCFLELEKLLKKVEPTEDDQIVSLGDIVDRGPSSQECFNILISTNVTECPTQMVLGNHDAKIIQYLNHFIKAGLDPNYKIPMKKPEDVDKLSTTSTAFLHNAPHVIRFKDFPGQPLVCVHAGLRPKDPFGQDPKAFIRNRYFLESEGRLIPAKSTNVDGVWNVPEGAKEWAHYWRGEMKVIYGHAVQKAPKMLNNTIGIDLGCCFGGFLCAWIYEPGYPDQFVYIKSETNVGDYSKRSEI